MEWLFFVGCFPSATPVHKRTFKLFVCSELSGHKMVLSVGETHLYVSTDHGHMYVTVFDSRQLHTNFYEDYITCLRIDNPNFYMLEL